MFYHSKYEVLTAVVPVLADVLPEVELPRGRVDHRVEGLAGKHYLRGLPREFFEGYFELEFSVFIEVVADEEQSVPD